MWNTEPVREVLLYEEQLCFNNLQCKYNILKVAGSTAGTTISESHKEAISRANKGKTVSVEARKRIAAAALIQAWKIQPAAFAAQTKLKKDNARGWTLASGKYRVRLRVNGKKIEIGYFDTQQSAEIAYRNAREHYDTK